jgi:DNA-binding NtrC family response regulator
MGNRRILCVHQGPELKHLSGVLEQGGSEVLTVSDPRKALDLLASTQVDGVVLDSRLKGPDGILLRNRILHQCPEIPMLLIEDSDSVRNLPLDVFCAYVDEPRSPEFIFAHFRN